MRKRNTSKRIKLKTKYTNIKKRKERKIKTKRDMKKNPNKYHKKKSDPGIPNSAPFKAKVLQERDQYLEKKEQEKKKQRDEFKRQKEEMKNTKVGQKRKLTDVIELNNQNGDEDDSAQIQFPDDEMHLNVDLDGPAGKKQKLMEDNKKELDPEVLKARKLALKAKNEHKKFVSSVFYHKNKPESNQADFRWTNPRESASYRQVKDVVESANVVLQVLDARDPMGTRCPVLEQLVRDKGKKLVLVLNKADLIPRSNLQAWLKFLRAEAPTVAFKAATHRARKFKKTLQRWLHIGEETMRTSLTMGGDVLIQLLKNYTRSHEDAGIVVGVVGFPNVGKSSLINSLKKIKACDVAPVPGCTKYIQHVKLDTKLYLVDSPGVVLPSYQMDKVEAVLKNIVKINHIGNLEECALEIFRRCDSLKLALFYSTRKTEDGMEFLSLLAKRFKKISSGGTPDTQAAATKLVYDWNHGILKYYTEPPKFNENEVKSEIVSKLAPAFDLDTLATNKEQEFLNHIGAGYPSVTMSMQASKPITDIRPLVREEMEEDAEEMEEEDAGENGDKMDEDVGGNVDEE